jgi:hypothetical protein
LTQTEKPGATKGEGKDEGLYEAMPLEDLIRLYASVVGDYTLDALRVQLHNALADKLGVKHDEFAPQFPFRSWGFTEKEAESGIRREIKRLKDEGKIPA